MTRYLLFLSLLKQTLDGIGKAYCHIWRRYVLQIALWTRFRCCTYTTITLTPQSEHHTLPDPTQYAAGARSIPFYHGFDGAVQVSFPLGMYTGPQQSDFIGTVTNLTNLTHSPDLNDGEPNCVAYTPLVSKFISYFGFNCWAYVILLYWKTLYPNTNGTRSSSAEAYLTPVENTRTNWLTLTNHQVSLSVSISWTFIPCSYILGNEDPAFWFSTTINRYWSNLPAIPVFWVGPLRNFRSRL